MKRKTVLKITFDKAIHGKFARRLVMLTNNLFIRELGDRIYVKYDPKFELYIEETYDEGDKNEEK